MKIHRRLMKWLTKEITYYSCVSSALSADGNNRDSYLYLIERNALARAKRKLQELIVRKGIQQ